MNTYTVVLLTALAIAALVAAGTYAYRTVKEVLRNRLRNQVLRSMGPWERDQWNVQDLQQQLMMKLYDTKPEDRPIIVSFIKTEKGDGSIAISYPTGWHGEDPNNYAKGPGLEILKMITSGLALMEVRTSKNVIDTLLILLEEQVKSRRNQPIKH